MSSLGPLIPFFACLAQTERAGVCPPLPLSRGSLSWPARLCFGIQASISLPRPPSHSPPPSFFYLSLPRMACPGSFRLTCENVLEVLRNNRESLMAMLEAFVHDPLITWRLLPTEAVEAPSVPASDPALPPSIEEEAQAQEREEKQGLPTRASRVHLPALGTSLAVIHEEGEMEQASTCHSPVQPCTTPSSVAKASRKRTLSSKSHQHRRQNSRNVLMIVQLFSGETESTGEMNGGSMGHGSPAGGHPHSSTGLSSAAGTIASLHASGRHQASPSPLCFHKEAGILSAPASSSDAAFSPTDGQTPTEEIELNQRALAIMERIQQKLLGRDYPSLSYLHLSGNGLESMPPETRGGGEGLGKEEDLASSASLSSSMVGVARVHLSVEEQVDRLIKEATSVENLCRLFMGWCPFW